MSKSPARNSAFPAISIVVMALLAFVIWPIYSVFEAAWTGRESSEPGLSVSSQHVPLALHTVKLLFLVLAIALPTGSLTALFIFRTNAPAKWLWRVLILLPALVPLDLHATAWLAAAGPQGLAKSLGLPIELKGLWGAAWVHAMASISWIVAFTAPALYAVEAELEEDCLLLTGPIGSMWHVTLRRSLGGIVAAGLIVAVQTAGEMAVTDLLQVRTYAETIYTEFALASRVGAATATAIPGLFVWCVLVAAAGILLVRYVPQNAQALFARRPEFKLPIGRWLVLLACVIVVAATLGVPITSLVWRTGLKFPSLTARPNVPNSPRAQPNDPAISADDLKPHWSAASFRKNVLRSFESASDQLILSLKVAAATAVIVVPSAWLLITLAQSSSVGQSIFAGLAAVLFAMPGPVLGIGLKLASGQASNWLNDTASLGGRLNNWSEAWNQVTAIGWVAELPPAILVWLHSLRSLPFVLAVLWPMRRLVNRRLLEAARIDGAGAWARFRFVELPACRPGLMAALLIAAVISLGELSGSVMVTPPGQQPLSVRIFTLAHYGLESHLAGICLLLLAVSTAGALSVMACVYWSLRTLRD